MVGLRKIMVTGVWLLSGLLASMTAQAELNIAFVDVDRAVASSEGAQKLLRQLQEEFRTDEDTIKKIQTQAAELLQKMQKDSEVMSDDEKRRLQQEIESLNNDFVYQRQKLQKKLLRVRTSYLPALRIKCEGRSKIWSKKTTLT